MATKITADVEAVIAKGLSQVGISESPPYSNRTPYTAWYGLVGPWCAMFVSWCFTFGGSPLPPIRTSKGFAYCPDIVAFAKANGIWHDASSTYRPKRGDIVLFDFPGDGVNRPSHVEIVLAYLGVGRVQTLGGNTMSGGGRDGGSVVIHNRSVAGGIIGYVSVENKAKATGPAPLPPYPGRVLVPNDRNHDYQVAVLAVLLIAAGFGEDVNVAPGRADIFGPGKARAVIRAKKAHDDLMRFAGKPQEAWFPEGVEPDPDVGPRFWAFLCWCVEVKRKAK